MSAPVELRIAPSREAGFSVERDEQGPDPLASARGAVPLLWLALFEYDDIEIKRHQGQKVFAATISVSTAKQRAEATSTALPQGGAARTAIDALVANIDQAPEEQQLALFPAELFETFERAAAARYIEMLFKLSQLWHELRGQMTWEDARRHLKQLNPSVERTLDRDEQATRYYLVGSIAERTLTIEDYLVREGQGEQDTTFEALAVGEQGLLLGRFDGRWKLMSSGTEHDLHGVWADADGQNAFLVGKFGTVIALQGGRCRPVETPIESHLNAVWGVNPRSVCAVGDAGTVLAFNGQDWQPWPVPTGARLHGVAGFSAEDLFVVGDQTFLRFDGYDWTRQTLPSEGSIMAFGGDDERLVAVGGSRRGGALFWPGEGGWVEDGGLPRCPWLIGAWKGWEQQVVVVPESGEALALQDGRWQTEALPAEQVAALSGGEQAMCVGRSGRYSLVITRYEHGWQIETAVPHLRLLGIWVAGEPLPPKARLDEPADDEDKSG